MEIFLEMPDVLIEDPYFRGIPFRCGFPQVLAKGFQNLLLMAADASGKALQHRHPEIQVPGSSRSQKPIHALELGLDFFRASCGFKDR
jgi:hypothetical protein